jgi:ribosomal-protein-alanine N-acetyltransferase
MNEHDLLEVVEIEEASGLSRWGWDAYRQELDRPEAVMLVAHERAGGRDGGRVLGFVAARACADELHVNNIGVRAGLRRRGMGARLLGAALERAARDGARRAVLEVRAGNEAAQALYRHFGFEVTGRRRDYYKEPAEDALVMALKL